ncbi:hypothetical protein B9479_002785 [Cryptococcus floricola]|uniref:Major facilitator superfamily (MFS) profile domain-containing protein n=1 Tax=Cryptococcus floricola TaxID=2591691 RepID=A0A5D3B0D4_9TREE|nr:hypothetical protein B9479_002785 [Cryptococcus floricola]
MLEPVEAEFAKPPIYNDAQEEAFQSEETEEPNAITYAANNLTRVETREGRQASPTHSQSSTLQNNGVAAKLDDPEKGGYQKTADSKILVTFDVGEDPKEWTKFHKLATITASTLCLTVALGSAMPTGDLPGAAEGLHVSDEVIYLTITLFVAGFGIGPLFFAPLSELYGRQPVYMVSIIFYFLFTLPSCLAKNVATTLAGRMIAGIASSAPFTNVGGTIADVWDVQDRGIPMAVYSSTLFMGPCLGPLFGGWIALKTGTWRWIYWVLFITIGASCILCLFNPETLAPVLLRKKAKKLNKQHNTDAYTTEADLHRPSFGTAIKAALIRPFAMMIEPIIILFTFYLSFVYALLYATFFAFPIAFEEIRGWNMGMTGVSFVSIIASFIFLLRTEADSLPQIGIFLANILIMPLQERLYRKYTARHGASPEGRLYTMMIGATVLPPALFILAFTSYPGVSWVGPCICGIMFGFAMVSIYISGNSYIVDSYSNVAASAISSKNMIRSFVGASVPLWITQLFHNLGFQYAGLFLALVSVVLMPIPFFFFWKGAWVRSKSDKANK